MCNAFWWSFELFNFNCFMIFGHHSIDFLTALAFHISVHNLAVVAGTPESDTQQIDLYLPFNKKTFVIVIMIIIVLFVWSKLDFVRCEYAHAQ